MNHDDRRLASILALASGLALSLVSVTPRPALASQCPEYDIHLENVAITVDPETPCLAVSVEGDLVSCEQPIVRFENGCAGDVTFIDPPKVRCEDQECSKIAPGEEASAFIREDELVGATHATLVYTVQIDGADVEITIDADLDNKNVSPDGCRVAPSSGGAPVAAGVLGALVLAGALRRRRRRQGRRD